MKPIAYRLSLKDIDAHFYEDAPKAVFCDRCHSVINKDYVPSSLKIYSGKPPDLGCTYDGQAVCSQRFKDYCEMRKYSVVFFEMVSKVAIYHFRPTQILGYDAVTCGTRFLERCSRCGGYEEVIGSNRVCLKGVAGPIQRGIFRTDLEFGTAQQKGAKIIAGLDTREEMVKLKFSGCSFSPIT